MFGAGCCLSCTWLTHGGQHSETRERHVGEAESCRQGARLLARQGEKYDRQPPSRWCAVGVVLFAHAAVVCEIMSQQSTSRSCLPSSCRPLLAFRPRKGSLSEAQSTVPNVLNHRIIEDVSTRWNSAFYMVERLLENRRPLTIYAVNNEVTLSSSNQITVSLVNPTEVLDETLLRSVTIRKLMLNT